MFQFTRPAIAFVASFALLSPRSVAATEPCSQCDRTAVSGSRTAAFLENRGQWDDSVRFAADRLGYRAIVTDRSIQLWPPGANESSPSVRVEFEEFEFGSPRGKEAQPGVRHFLIGSDPSHWARDIRAFERVDLESVDGSLTISLSCRGDRLEFDVQSTEVESIEKLRVRLTGARAVPSNTDSTIAATLGQWELRLLGLQTYAVDSDGTRRAVECRMEFEENEITFKLHDGSCATSIVIDPGLEWATALGGVQASPASGPPGLCAAEVTRQTMVAANGDVIVLGQVCTLDFPTTPGAYDATFNGSGGYRDITVSRLSANGSALVWSTYIGGSNSTEDVHDAQLLASGRVVFAGYRTDSVSTGQFPTTPGTLFPNDPTKNGASGLLCCLDSDGASIVYSTYFSTAANSQVTCLSIVDENTVWIGGAQLGSNLPITSNALQPVVSPSLSSDESVGFVARIDYGGTQLGYSSFVGGSANTGVLALHAVTNDRVILAGVTNSTDYPVTPGAFATSGGHDAMLSILETGKSTFAASTYLGGPTQTDIGDRLALDSQGFVYLTGRTDSVDFPTTPGVPMPLPYGLANGFLAKLSPDLGSLEYATYITGAGTTTPQSLIVDPSGAATVVGNTNAFFLPTTPGAYKTQKSGTPGKIDGFAMRFSPDATSLYYSTYFGGTLNDAQILGTGSPVGAIDGVGSLIVAGETFSQDFGFTPGAFDTTVAVGDIDLFVAKLDMSPTGVTKVGQPTAGCFGSPYAEALEMPVAGDLAFQFRCVGGPKAATGFLLASPNSVATPANIACMQIWIELSGSIIVPVTTDANGTTNLSAMLRPHFAHQMFAVQFVFPDPCGPCGFSSSNALRVEVQP